jgi:PPOX class probable F420-dependent enzyme
VSVIPEQYLDLLQSTTVITVATIGPKGEPQNNPVWFGWDGSHVLFSITKGRQKYRNLVREPRVALSIFDPTNPGRYLEIRGVARIEQDTDHRFVNSMAKKYLNQDVFPWGQPGDERVIIIIEPQHITKMS